MLSGRARFKNFVREVLPLKRYTKNYYYRKILDLDFGNLLYPKFAVIDGRRLKVTCVLVVLLLMTCIILVQYCMTLVSLGGRNRHTHTYKATICEVFLRKYYVLVGYDAMSLDN